MSPAEVDLAVVTYLIEYHLVPTVNVTVAVGKMCLLFEKRTYTDVIVDHQGAHLLGSPWYCFLFFFYL